MSILLCCGVSPKDSSKNSDLATKANRTHEAFDRAIRETKKALKYPETAVLPPFDSATIFQTGDTIYVTFNFLAANGFGVKSKLNTTLTFLSDSCLRVLHGLIADDILAKPDPIDEPCDPEARRALYASRRAAMKREYLEDSVFFLSRSIKIDRIEGKAKYGGFTRVEWTPLPLMIQMERDEAKKTMKPSESTEAVVEAYKASARGGRIQLNVERITIGAANNDNFTIIVHDSTGAEVHREALESEVANSSHNGNWWNLDLITVTERIRPPFDIYIVDAVEEQAYRFKVVAAQ